MVTEMAGFKQYVPRTTSQCSILFNQLRSFLCLGHIAEGLHYYSKLTTLITIHKINAMKNQNVKMLHFPLFPNLFLLDVTLSFTQCFISELTWCVDRLTPVRQMWIVSMCWPVSEPLSTRYLTCLIYISIPLFVIYAKVSHMLK